VYDTALKNEHERGDRGMRYLFLVLMIAIALLFKGAEGKAADTVIQNGKQVAFDYALTVDGKVVDSSVGKQPLEYTQGDGKLIPGLTKQLEGLRVGDEKTIVLPPEEAYGQPDPNAFKEVPRSNLPADVTPEVGMSFQAKDVDGNVFAMRISELKKDSVVMDLNHPLAGKILTFKVKVVSIK